MVHKKQWEFIKKNFTANQLSHAYLFSGEKDIGKKSFVKEVSKLVNCKEKDAPCQKCFSCKTIENENFPDVITLRATKKDQIFGDGGEIKISKIREAQNFLNLKPYQGTFKIVIVEDAEKMNQEAQSCFLKTLEEPKGQTIIFLVSSKPDLLLSTITSRCQTVKFFKSKDTPVNKKKLEREKEILNGLFKVLNLGLAEKFQYVKSINFDEQDAGEIALVLQKYLRHVLLVKVGVEKSEEIDKPFLEFSVERLQSALNAIELATEKISFTNANSKLALEVMLMQI